jgi:hypothetical protein
MKTFLFIGVPPKFKVYRLQIAKAQTQTSQNKMAVAIWILQHYCPSPITMGFYLKHFTRFLIFFEIAMD